MPSTSPKQHRFMEAVAHNPAFAAKVGVPQTVGQDFANADESTGNFTRAQRIARVLHAKRSIRT